MSREIIPPPEEQAEEILEKLRAADAKIADDIEPSDLTAEIDPDKPVSVNLKRIAKGLEETL